MGRAEKVYYGGLIAFGPLSYAVALGLLAAAPSLGRLPNNGPTNPYWGLSVFVFLGLGVLLIAIVASLLIRPRAALRIALRLVAAPALMLLSLLASAALLTPFADRLP